MRQTPEPDGGSRRLELALAGWFAASRFVIAGTLFAAAATVYRIGLGRTDRPPLWAVLALTALVATVLWALRKRLARFAERQTFGPDARGYREVSGLLARMAATLPIDDVIPNLAQTLAERAHSVRTEVRLNLEDGGQWAEVWPALAAPARAQLTVQVTHLGEEVGQIDIEQQQSGPGDYDRRLLDSIAGPAGLALSAVRLTLALRRRAAALEALNDAIFSSQQRLIDARAGEWRRFRAEIDHRVLPHLDRASAMVTQAQNTTEPAVDLRAAAFELSGALDVLRTIARGVFPPRLADAGLEVSLESWRDGAARVELLGDAGAIHDDPELEACVYFSVVTGLDAVSGADRPAAKLTVTDDAVDFAVSGDRPATDDTVLAIRDRVEAFDGSLDEAQADSMLIRGHIPRQRRESVRHRLRR